MKYYGIVYCHMNKTNGKCYVGQTTQANSERRFRKGTKGSYDECPAFKNAIDKYGWDNFETKEIVTAFDKAGLDEFETFFIDYFQSLNTQNGYNVRPAAEGQGKHAESTKEKLRQKQLAHQQKLRDEGIKVIPVNKRPHVEKDGLIYKTCSGYDNVEHLVLINDFGKKDDTWDGLLNTCRHCRKINQRIVRQKNPPKKLTEVERKQSHINRKDAISEGLKKFYSENPDKINGKQNSKQVKCIDIVTSEVRIYESQLATKIDGFNSTNVSQACNGKYCGGSIYKGFRWEFVKKD